MKTLKKIILMLLIASTIFMAVGTTAFADEVPADDLETADTNFLDSNKQIITSHIEYAFIKDTVKRALSTYPKEVIGYIKDAYMNTERVGTHGRLFIPSVGVDVAAFRMDLGTYRLQEVTDAKDSACVFKYGKQMVIADHKHQGFDAIYNVKLGDYLVMKRKNGNVEIYVCMEKGNGINNGDLYKDGVMLTRLNAHGYTTYTCNQNRYHITIIFWQPVLIDKFENIIPMTVSFMKMDARIKDSSNKTLSSLNDIKTRLLVKKALSID